MAYELGDMAHFMNASTYFNSNNVMPIIIISMDILADIM